jgi:predicted alpha/beta hydrolase
VFGHRPFRVLADHLTRNGIAVLRVDDRGVGGSTGKQGRGATSEDFATDVIAGMDWLAKRPDIAKRKIGSSATARAGSSRRSWRGSGATSGSSCYSRDRDCAAIR